MGVEWDERCVPPDFQAQSNDRIAVFGRLIVDAGHEDFHTEIHPPLLLAAAQADATTTRSSVIARPYLVSQDFSVTPGDQTSDGATLVHLVREIAKALSPIPQSSHIEIHPIIPPKPFRGDHTMQYVLRPPVPLPHEFIGQFQVAYRFVARSGVAVEFSQLDPVTLGVTISLHEAQYQSPQLPPRSFPDIQPGSTDLGPTKALLIQEGSSAIAAAIGAALGVAVPVFGVITAIHAINTLNKGWLTDSYAQPPLPAQPAPTVVRSSNLKDTPIQIQRNDSQPWPVCGFIDISVIPEGQHVFARKASGELIHYHWSAQPGWAAENLTQRANIGPALRIDSDPQPINL